MNSVAKESKAGFEEKKSKFICHIKPVSSVEEAKSFINDICKKYKDARHNVPVYRVFEDGQEFFKFYDDGEPKNTAGKPAADILSIMNVSNVVMVITRYFGGIKLGAGGLIRAYAKAAKVGVESAGIVELKEKRTIYIDFPYSKVGEIDRFVLEKKITLLEKIFEERVGYRLEIELSHLEELYLINGIVIID